MKTHTLTPKGVIEITATDEETGLVRTVTDQNVCVELLHTLQNNGYFGYLNMQISSRKFAKNARNYRFRGPGYQEQDSTNSQVISDPYNLHLNDWYAEKTFVFNAAGVDRDINSILLTMTDFTTSHSVDASIALDNTFVQGASELLSIKYRFIVNTSSLTEMEALKLGFHLYVTASYYNWASISHGGYVRGLCEYMGENTADETFYYNEITEQEADSGNTTSYYRTGVDMGWEKTEENGRYVAGYGYISRFLYPGSTDFYINVPFKVPQLLSKDNHAGIPNYPMGPLFNHSEDAVSRFEDVNNLASGLGYPIISCVDEPTFEMDGFDLETQRFNITKSGNSGTARFDISLDPISSSGLISNGTAPRHSFIGIYGLADNGVSLSSTKTGAPDHASLADPDTHPMSKPILEYNSEWVICMDVSDSKTALVLLNTLDHSRVIGFDSLTTPPLPTGNTRNGHRVTITRNFDGDIFYLVDDGYVVIRDPLGTPSIESKSLATLGAASTLSRISVQGDLIQLSAAGEFIYSVDAGVTWTVLACSNIPTDSYCRMVGGDITNPTKVIVGSNTVDLSWFDASTNTLASITGVDIWDLNAYFDETTGYYYVASRPESNSRYYIFAAKWGNVTPTITNYYSTTTYSTSYTNQSPVRLVKLKSGGFGILTYTGIEDGTLQLWTPDGVSARVPVNASLTRSVSREIYYLTTPVNFIGDIYDDYDGLSTSHFGKSQSYYRTYNSTPYRLTYFTPKDNSEMDALRSVYSKTYRWDSDNSEWKKGWNKVASATSGSSVSVAERIGFSTDSNLFSHGSRLDVTDAVNEGTYNTNGFSFLVNATEESKVTSTIPADWTGNYSSQNNPLACVFELSEPSSGKSIALMHCGYTNQLSVIDYTDTGTDVHAETTLGVTPGTSTVRYCLTLNAAGTTVSVYMNGALQGSAITLSAPFPVTGTLECSVGTRTYGLGRIKSYCSPFTGALENILVYEKELSAAEALTDSGTPLGTTVSGDLVVQYSMTEDYLEGKLTSTSDQTCINDVAIRFPDGDLSADSYVSGDDYFSVKATRGMVKDNATTVNFGCSFALTHQVINECTSPHTGLDTFTAGTPSVTDLPLVFQQGSSQAYQGHHVGAPSSLNDYSHGNGAGLTGDVSFEWDDYCPTGYGFIYLGDRTTAKGSSSSSNYSLRLTYNTNSVTLTGSGISEVISHTREINDRWKLSVDETLDTMTLYWWDGSAWVQKNVNTMTYSTQNASTGPKYIVVQPDSTARPLMTGNMTGTGAWMGNVMYIGDKTTGTGAYSKSFRGIVSDSIPLGMMQVTLDGVVQTMVNKTTVHGSASTTISNDGARTPDIDVEPPIGSYFLYTDLGMLVFNTAEVGKTVAVSNVTIDDSGSLDDL